MQILFPVSLHDDDRRRNPASSDVAAPAAMPHATLTPDRRRIDSDVRCFLRQPSTPWITFDSDGRPSQVAVGEILTSGRGSISAEAGFFPADTAGAATSAPDAKAEPSSLVVASDVTSGSVPAMRLVESDPFAPGASGEADDADEAAFLPKRPARRTLAVVGAVTGVAAIVAIGLGVTAASSVSLPRAGAATQAIASQESHAAAPAEAASPSRAAQPKAAFTAPVDLPPDLAAAASTPAPAARATKAPSSTDEDAKPAAPKFGRLTINGRARHTNVYFDGKRLLGSGTRSFVVICGPHTIAVGNKADAKDVDVPCNAETVISQ